MTSSRLIGRGGMGEVYYARDRRLGRDVALKVLPEASADDRDRLSRFEREAKVLAALNHPNICTVHEIGEHGGSLFIVMEYVAGRPLSELIAQAAFRSNVSSPSERRLRTPSGMRTRGM